MRILIPTLAVALLAACGPSEEEQVQEAIKVRLKDPDSARFRLVLVNARKDTACAVWNAKNSFGGYGEWSTSELKKQAGSWRISQPELREDHCEPDYYRLMNELDEATEAVKRNFNR